MKSENVSIEQREQLTGYQYTICGVRCKVGGWTNKTATIAPESGRFFSAKWKTVQRVADNGGAFSASDVRFLNNKSPGINPYEPADLVAIVPQRYR